ncbi:MAG TPA: hypothetical protein VEH84_13790 [Alphaproteobacteria bacterium]|nr:hypothetical protein [Alphaproteobacteria bacterium]
MARWNKRKLTPPGRRAARPADDPAFRAGYAAALAELGALAAGEVIEYHLGWLSRDREQDAMLDGWAAALFDASRRGCGVLFQQRRGRDGIAYLFRRQAAPPLGGLAALLAALPAEPGRQAA